MTQITRGAATAIAPSAKAVFKKMLNLKKQKKAAQLAKAA